jgi:hypothetical protein
MDKKHPTFADCSRAPSVIFTCSTFLSKPNKPLQLQTALESIVRSHSSDELRLVRELVVVNEYPPPHENPRARIEAIHPGLEYIQKGPDRRGQAGTLNLILERARAYDYWIHWEESWECTRPFLAEAVDVMRSTDLVQVQLTPDWMDVGAGRIVHAATGAGARYARILAHPRTLALVRGKRADDYAAIAGRAGMAMAWPLFSLRPGINRAAFCCDVGPFSEDPRHWPIGFEWEYAARWLDQGGTKGVLLPHVARRQPNHVSTYA